MTDMIKADLYKARKSKILLISFFVCLIFSIIMAYVQHNIATGSLDKSLSGNFSLLADDIIVSLLGSVLISAIVCGDITSKNIHNEITGGYSRNTIIIEKFIISALSVFIITLPYAIVSLVGFIGRINMAEFTGIPSGFFTLMCNNAEVSVSSSNIAKSIIIVLLIMYTYIARLSICIPFALKTNNLITIIVGFASSFLFDMIAGLISKVKIIKKLYDYIPYRSMFKTTITTSPSTLIKVFLSSTIFIIIIYLISSSLFKKQDIK